jgi:hypothetical protein
MRSASTSATHTQDGDVDFMTRSPDMGPSNRNLWSTARTDALQHPILAAQTRNIKSPCFDVRDKILTNTFGQMDSEARCPMPNAQDLMERARMFEERAERASDPISRQHYREMAAHYRSLAVEHQEIMGQPEHESAH